MASRRFSVFPCPCEVVAEDWVVDETEQVPDHGQYDEEPNSYSYRIVSHREGPYPKVISHYCRRTTCLLPPII